jgi:hypothetical protein
MRVRSVAITLAIGIVLAACSSAAATPSPATPSPTATSAAPASVASSAFHLEKTCDNYTCTVTKSSYSVIPVGTTIVYSGPNAGALSAAITVSGGSATGQCDIGSLPGKCSFSGGTGSLAGFKLDVVVTQTTDGLLWLWDSTTAP